VFPLRDIAARELNPDTGQRERNRLRTRADLNSAAVRRFAQHGYDGTTVDDICTEAGVSVRTFFRYFDGKEDVLFARQMDIRGFLDGLAAQTVDVPPIEAIRRAYLAQPRLTAEEVEVSVLFHQGMATSPTLQGRYVEGLRYFRERVARGLAARAGRTAPNEADVLAATIGQATLDHAYSRWIDRGTPGDLRRSVETAFRLLDEMTPTDAADVPVARPASPVRTT
jgi:AcrR family transcriptional regulator